MRRIENIKVMVKSKKMVEKENCFWIRTNMRRWQILSPQLPLFYNIYIFSLFFSTSSAITCSISLMQKAHKCQSNRSVEITTERNYICKIINMQKRAAFLGLINALHKQNLGPKMWSSFPGPTTKNIYIYICTKQNIWFNLSIIYIRKINE